MSTVSLSRRSATCLGCGSRCTGFKSTPAVCGANPDHNGPKRGSCKHEGEKKKKKATWPCKLNLKVYIKLFVPLTNNAVGSFKINFVNFFFLCNLTYVISSFSLGLSAASVPFKMCFHVLQLKGGLLLSQRQQHPEVVFETLARVWGGKAWGRPNVDMS